MTLASSPCARAHAAVWSQEDDGLGILLPAPLPARPGTWRRNGTVTAWAPRQSTTPGGATREVAEQQPGDAEPAAGALPLTSPVVAQAGQGTAQAGDAAMDEQPAAIQAGTAPFVADGETAAQTAANQLPVDAVAQEAQTATVTSAGDADTPGPGSLDGATRVGTTAAAGKVPLPIPDAAQSAAGIAAGPAGSTAGQEADDRAVVQSEPQQGGPAETQSFPLVSDTGAVDAGLQPAQEGGAAATETSVPQGEQPAQEVGGGIAETGDLQGAQPAPDGGAAVTQTGVLPGEATTAAQLDAGPATILGGAQPDAAAPGESMLQQQTQTG